MAYQDNYYNKNQYTSPPRPQNFAEPSDSAYNPYDNSQLHPTYDQGGYDTSGYGAYSDDPSGGVKEMRDRAVFDGDDVLPPRPAGPYSSRKMKQWRYDHQGALWTRGSRVRCCGRFFCCTIMIAVFLIASILLSMALWIKPPNVLIGNPQLANDGNNTVQLTNDSLTVNMFVNVSVNNPNYLSVDFSDIKADLFYPLNDTDTPIGGGDKKHVDIKANTQTNFSLPLAIVYNDTSDPNLSIIEDLANKCGLLPGSTKQNINIKYKITLKFTVLVVPVSPVVSGTFNLACPADVSSLSGVLKGLNIDLSTVISSVSRSEPLQDLISKLGSSVLSFLNL